MAVNDFLAGQFHKIRLLKQSVRGEVWLAEDSAGHFVVWKETTVTGLPYNILKNNPYRLWPKVLYYVETETGSVIIEEYINGENISDRLAMGKQFSKTEVMSILWQLVDGLTVLHKLGIIHRDIKPGNLIWQNGDVYLIDFEAARQPNKENECDTQLLGTRGYAAPEQFGFAQTDIRSDIYSLGVTIKELAGNDISADLAELLRWCTALDPAQRFQSVEEIKDFWQQRKRKGYLKMPLQSGAAEEEIRRLSENVTLERRIQIELDKTKIKKVEVVCFFFKEKMNLEAMQDEVIKEMESSPLENLLSSFTKKRSPEFKETSKELRRSLKAEGDMFLAYDDTYFQTGDEGFVVTSKGVFVKSGGTRCFVDFGTLSQMENLRFEDNELRGDGNLLAVFSGSEEAKESVVEFFEEVIDILNDIYDGDDD